MITETTNLTNKNVIVAGGAGYIGSMTAKLLKRAGYNPVVVDDLRGGHKFLAKFGALEEVDIGDINKMNSIMQKYKPVGVIHFAAVPSVPEANANPWQAYNNNVMSTNNLVKTMLDNGINNLIFSSTAALFGETDAVITEKSKIAPISIYGRTKAIMESILDEYANCYNLQWAALRYFNVSGADPELEVGECHICETHLIPVMLEKAATGQEFTLFGNDYNTEGGTCIRDYIHVYDIANAHVMALNKLLTEKQSFKVNLGNGKGFSVKEMVEITKQVTGVDFKVVIKERRQGDPAKIITDNSFAKQYLNWQPQYVDPKSHIQHAWDWYKKYQQIKKHQ